MTRLFAFIFCLLQAAQAEKPASMVTRVFRTPPAFMRPEMNAPAFDYQPTQFRELPDPFATEPKTVETNVRDTARSFLEKQGIPFPKGSASFYDAATHTLTVRSTPALLGLIESYLEDLATEQPYGVSFHIQVIEAPGAVLRDLEKQVVKNAECGPALAALKKRAEKADSGLRVIHSARMEALSNHRSTYESVIEHAFCETLKFDTQNRLSVPYARRSVGALIELEPTVGPDHRTIELNYQIGLHPGLPAGRDLTITDPTTQEKVAFTASDFVLAHFVSSTTLTDGMTKLIAITKPPTVGPASTQDVLWGIFISARVQIAAIEPKARPQPHTLAEGLHDVTRIVPVGALESQMRHRPIDELPLPEADQKGRVADFLTRNGIPHVEGSVFTIESNTLLIRNTLENIERIDSMLVAEFSHGPKTSRFLLQIVEAPSALLRELSHTAQQHFDHASEWSRVLESIGDNSARHIETVWIEGKPWGEILLSTGRDHAFLDGLNLTPAGQSDLVIQRRHIGTSLKLTPVEDYQRHPNTFDYRLETHTAPENLRRLDFRDPSSQKKFDLPASDFHLARLTGRTVLHGGGVKLLSTWQPAGRPDLEKKDLQHAAFLQCVETTHLAPPREPGKTKVPAPKDPKAWETRRFHVPPDFLSFSAGAAAAQPEDAGPDDRYRLPTAQDVLLAYGIPFPEGASAHFDRPTSTLTVTNTVENLQLIESYTEELIKYGPKTVVMTTHLIEGSEKLLRQSIERCLTQDDHRGEMQRLLDQIATGSITNLGTLRLEAKGGTRATAKQATEHTHITEVGVNADGVPRLATPSRDVGFVLEAEPLVGPDGVTVELSLDFRYDTTLPTEHLEHLIDRATGKAIEVPLTDFHTTHLKTALTMISGSARIIGVWPGKSGKLQAVFLTCDVVPAE